MAQEFMPNISRDVNTELDRTQIRRVYVLQHMNVVPLETKMTEPWSAADVDEGTSKVFKVTVYGTIIENFECFKLVQSSWEWEEKDSGEDSMELPKIEHYFLASGKNWIDYRHDLLCRYAEPYGLVSTNEREFKRKGFRAVHESV